MKRIIFLIILMLFSIWCSFNFKVIHVIGTSMQPTLGHGDICFTVRGNSNVKRNDIIGFTYKDKCLVKRVIGLPGETVFVGKHSVTIIKKDGTIERLEDKYLSPLVTNPKICECTLGKDEFFVLGDNREVALDSPEIGPIKREQITFKFLFQITRIY